MDEQNSAYENMELEKLKGHRGSKAAEQSQHSIQFSEKQEYLR